MRTTSIRAIVVAAIATLSLMASSAAQAEATTMQEDLRMVAPVLEKYRGMILGEVWKRPGLSARDRSIVTLAALIARNQTIEMRDYLNLALDNGVKPREISEIITHLAFYSGWANATAAVAVAKDVFAARKIGSDQLPAASPAPLPLDEAAEAQRATRVGEQFGAVFPGIVQYTTDVLFRDLWLRPDLAPRDRSMVTVSALIATGQVAQLAAHLNLGMNNGLTQAEVAEAIAHLAFYVGWPNAFSALPVAKDVFEKRPRQPTGNPKEDAMDTARSAENPQGEYVQLAEIEIDLAQLDNYKAAVKEHIETAIRVEPGVLVLYAVFERDNPAHIRVFEIYRDTDAYQAHLQSAHFRKYKAATEKMVKSLKLVPTAPIMLGAKAR